MDIEKTDLLSSKEYVRPLVYASTGQRFVHRLVDLIAFYALFFTLAIATVIISGDPSILIPLENIDPLLDRLVTYVLYFNFVGLVEGLTKGKSLGKLLTGTRAVYDNGERITFGTGYLRGISQAVPFEIFSAFGGYPWHDQWTDTRVVTESSLADRRIES